MKSPQPHGPFSPALATLCDLIQYRRPEVATISVNRGVYSYAIHFERTSSTSTKMQRWGCWDGLETQRCPISKLSAPDQSAYFGHPIQSVSSAQKGAAKREAVREIVRGGSKVRRPSNAHLNRCETLPDCNPRSSYNAA